METIGSRLKKVRKAKEMTLDDLAVEINLAKQTIQRYESGQIANIPYDKMEKIAEILSVSPCYLAGWQESPVLDKYNQLNDNQKKIIDMLLDEFTR